VFVNRNIKKNLFTINVNVQRVKALTEENASLLAKVKELQTVNQQLEAKRMCSLNFELNMAKKK